MTFNIFNSVFDSLTASIILAPFEAIVPDKKGSDNMSEKQYQLLGAAQGMGMTPQPQAAKAKEK